MPQEIIDAMEQWASSNGAESRSEAIRRLVELGLKAKGRGGR
jgi:metal-responsive CopG/Arc/MetJ family transcriptional regulator